MREKLDSLTELIEAFDNLLVDLNAEWRLHKDLFQVPEHYILFADSGPIVWHMLRDALVDSVFMSIARLLDPPRSFGKKENLSISRILEHIAPGEERTLIDSEYNGLRASYDSALRDWRNRKLSHNDLLTITGVSPLPSVPYKEISQLIDEINKIGRRIGHVLQETHKTFVPVTSNQDWVWQLTDTVKEGIAAKEAKMKLREQRLNTGTDKKGS